MTPRATIFARTATLAFLVLVATSAVRADWLDVGLRLRGDHVDVRLGGVVDLGGGQTAYLGYDSGGRAVVRREDYRYGGPARAYCREPYLDPYRTRVVVYDGPPYGPPPHFGHPPGPGPRFKPDYGRGHGHFAPRHYGWRPDDGHRRDWRDDRGDYRDSHERDRRGW